jgi:hypothetical protein
MDNKIIYSLWVEGTLTNLNKLCIQSFKEQGHRLIIYSFDLNINADCEVRNAEEILSKDSIFFYKNFNDSMKFGGIAERLKAEMLYKLGGWHVDLDVVCLKSFFDIDNEYVFRPHPTGVVGNIIKAPARSTVAEKYVNWTRLIDSENRDWEKSFRGLTTAIKELELENYIVDPSIFGTDESSYWLPLLNTLSAVPDTNCYAVHFCGSTKYYENYVKGSFYEQLLQKYKLI